MNIQAKPLEDLLGLEGLVTTKVDRDSHPDEIFVYAKSTMARADCPYCMAVAESVGGHGREEGRFKDVAMQGRSKVTIIADRARHRCSECKKTWADPIPGLRRRSGMTKRLEEHIAKRCFEDGFMNIARAHGIDEGTVRNVFGRHVASKEADPRPKTPEVLGIDEIHLSDIPCVLTDVRRKMLFDIVPSRIKDDISPWFADLPDKENVRVVVADMWRPYHDVADRFFPGRLVVIDKFHVIRMANKGLDRVRKRVGRERSHEQRIRLKDVRFLLFKRRMHLTDEQRVRVDRWLREFPIMRQAYQAKERFTAAYDAGSRAQCEREIALCFQAMPVELDRDFQELLTAYGNWRERILNYFEDPVTNAYTESVNSIIRELDRVGRGYSFETMRALMLYDETERKKSTSTRSRRPKIPDDAYGFIDFDDLDDLDLGFAPMANPAIRSLDRIAKRLALEPTPDEYDD